MSTNTIGISNIIRNNMTLGEIALMERTCASTWNVIKDTTLKVEQNENYNEFNHKDIQNIQVQVNEFGRVLERIERELDGLRRDVRNANVVVIE